MQTETRSFIDEHGNMQLDFASIGKFRFHYPYNIEARQCIEYLQKLMRSQLLDDQINDIRDEMKEYN